MVVQRAMPQIVNGTIQDVQTNILQCIDIRTGEVLWERNGFDLAQGEQSFGSWIFTGAIEYPSLDIVYLSGDRLYKFNENTGATTLNVSIAPLTSAVHYMNGYALSVQNLGTTVPVADR